jgi:LL-diaminopimelate aminotransferase
MIREAQRLRNLPAYVFAELDRLKDEARKKGVDLIDLGMGNPDLPVAPQILEAMVEALKHPPLHRYPGFDGLPEFRHAVSVWCKKQYNIDINDDEVVPLIGSKEGLIHLAFAFINPGDVSLVPSPCYPAHYNGTVLSDGVPYILPTRPPDFLPDFDAVDKDILRRTKILFLSYPTNPTAATAPKEFFEKAVNFARENRLLFVHDFAYSELYFNHFKPPSALSIPGAKDVCIEFHSFSKTFSMAGWRAGFAVGNKKAINSLRRIKTNLDYGLFLATQKAAVAALNLPEEYFLQMRQTYKQRRNIFIDGLRKLGWEVTVPEATMYLWVKIPKNYNSTSFALDVLEKTGVVIAPGNAFGHLGEGFVRIALVDSEQRLKDALLRLEEKGIRFE